MSVLETPRLYFKGEISWDPVTTNNYDFNYDEDSGETKFADALDKVQAFRDKAIKQVLAKGNWNPHGTYRSSFFNTAINGFDLGNGTETGDPILNCPANFTGMLVDLEPYGAFSSQLFFDEMQFGVEGGYFIKAPRTSRITDRYINFYRNPANAMIAGVASVVWQTSFSKADGLSVAPFDSKALGALAAALAREDVEGLTVRFNAYRTIYYDDPGLTNGSPGAAAAAQALQNKLQGGGFQPNPARSLLVGVVGLWRKGEPAHEPGDRALLPTYRQSYSPVNMMSVHARVSGDTITFDLSNSVPETDAALTKKDYGPLKITAETPLSPATLELGQIDYTRYDRAAYEASAGIVTLALKPGQGAQLATANLMLESADGDASLAEVALRAIPSTPNLYLDEGESTTAIFQVYERGQPATSVQHLRMFQVDVNGHLVGQPAAMATDASGVLSLPLQATAGSITSYVPSFSPTDTPKNGAGINTQINTYMFFRTRPADADLAACAPTWENVYTKVLANWNAMAPCMDNWLMLNDPAQVRRYAAVLRRLTDPARFEDFRFMPITRDMSVGERTLLYRFLDSSPNDAEISAKAMSAVPQKQTFASMSRAMRGG